MKGIRLGYLTREGFKNIWVNRFLSVATILVLVTLGDITIPGEIVIDVSQDKVASTFYTPEIIEKIWINDVI